MSKKEKIDTDVAIVGGGPGGRVSGYQSGNIR